MSGIQVRREIFRFTEQLSAVVQVSFEVSVTKMSKYSTINEASCSAIRSTSCNNESNDITVPLFFCQEHKLQMSRQKVRWRWKTCGTLRQNVKGVTSYSHL